MNNWTRSANILVMDFYMPPHMIRTGGSVRTKLTLVRFFLVHVVVLAEHDVVFPSYEFARGVSSGQSGWFYNDNQEICNSSSKLSLNWNCLQINF